MAESRVAYGLAKRYGIDTTGMSPGEVWEALKKKGVTPENISEGAYDSRSDIQQIKSAVGKKENSNNEPAQSKTKKPSPEKAYGFANKERKNTKHHTAHAKEMGFKNQDEYERAAVDFFNSSKGKLYYGTARNRYYRYDESTGEYAVSSNGVIHTYMKKTKKEFNKAKIQEKLNEQ